MANPQHIEWLLEDVARWNARRELDSHLRFDFRDADLNKLFAEIAKLDAAGRVDLSGANLSQCDLSGVNLANAVLSGVNFDDTPLKKVNLEGANLEKALIGETSLDGANLKGANLRWVRTYETMFGNADLREADLRGVSFLEGSLHGADLSEANVTSLPPSDDPREPQFTNFRGVLNLDQNQLDSMLGDSGTIIPAHLTRPAHWPQFEMGEAAEGAVAAPPQPKASRPVSRETVERRLKTETATITLTTASLLEQIAAYRETIRGNNVLAAEHPKTYNGLLAFLDGLSSDLMALLGDLPAQGEPPSGESVERAASWGERFIGSAIPEWQKHLAPRSLGQSHRAHGDHLGLWRARCCLDRIQSDRIWRRQHGRKMAHRRIEKRCGQRQDHRDARQSIGPRDVKPHRRDTDAIPTFYRRG